MVKVRLSLSKIHLVIIFFPIVIFSEMYFAVTGFFYNLPKNNPIFGNNGREISEMGKMS